VDLFIDTIRARKVRVATFILDACRDNPFAATGTRSLGGSRGLGAPPAVEGTFILYSAAAGQTALDRLSDGDKDPNSVFTRALLPLLATPGLTVSDLAIAVRQDVLRIAASVGHAQRIAYYNELNGDYVLHPSVEGATLSSSMPQPDPPPVVAPLSAPVALPDPEPRSREDIIRATQAELGRIGCNAGLPDGLAGRKTATALRFYAMLKGWGEDLPGEIGSDDLLAALEVESERVCASRWIAEHVPMALSGDWSFSMQCANNLGAEGSAILVVEPSGAVRGAVTNAQGQTRALSGRITPDRFSGEIDGRGDPPLSFDLALSDYATSMEGTDSFGCFQTYQR
jgi:Caspase domain